MINGSLIFLLALCVTVLGIAAAFQFNLDNFGYAGIVIFILICLYGFAVTAL